MKLEIHVTADQAVLYLLRELNSQIGSLMSKVSDAFAQVKAGLTDIQTRIKTLDDRIAAFQNSPGDLPPADQAALDEIQALVKDLASTANDPAVIPTVNPAPGA